MIIITQDIVIVNEINTVYHDKRMNVFIFQIPVTAIF